MSASRPNIFVSAGEPSGDAHAASLVTELINSCGGPDSLDVFGMGGANLRRANVDTIVDSEVVGSAMGLVEVIGSIRGSLGALDKLATEAKDRRPQFAILVDYPDFHFELAKRLKRLNIPVIYFISPQIWAWRQGRAKLMKRFVDLVIPIFPFEVDFYRKVDVKALFLGHPLCDKGIEPNLFKREFPRDPKVAILPGSRISEVRKLLPDMLKAFQLFKKDYPDSRALLPVAENLCANSIKSEFIDPLGELKDSIEILPHQADFVYKNADLGMITSGTATLEAAYYGLPFVTMYRFSGLTYVIAKLLVRGVKNFSIVNIILQSQLVKELLQHQVTPQNIYKELKKIASSQDHRKEIAEGFAVIREKLSFSPKLENVSHHSLASMLENSKETFPQRAAAAIKQLFLKDFETDTSNQEQEAARLLGQTRQSLS